MRLAITGGTGSLGRSIIARLLQDRIGTIVSLSRDEVKAGDLKESFNDHPDLRVFLADVRDRERLVQAFWGCDIVIHAAALKRITESVYSPSELIKTNVEGTANVIDAATAARVKKIIVVSSDKAVAATNLYGMTKAVAECYAVQANAYTAPRGTYVSAVRYGNVLGSRGSVVHIWRSTAAAGKPLRLTDPRMTRFIITLPQAVQFVLDAAWDMIGGEIFVPALVAATMTDLAEAIAPNHPVEITGLRPGGEKLGEVLLSEEEPRRTFNLGDRFIVTPSHRSWSTQPWKGEPVPESFTYHSETWPARLGVEELRKLVEEIPA